MKNLLKNIAVNKFKVVIFACFASLLFANLDKFYISFVSLYYFFVGMISGENIGNSISEFAEYWVCSLYLLIVLILLFVGIFRKSPIIKPKSFFIKKLVDEFDKNRIFRFSILTMLLIISVGFLAPFVAPLPPDEINSVSITKYLPPLSSAKYIYYNEISFEPGKFSYLPEEQNYSGRLNNLMRDIKPKKQKIYFDSLKIDGYGLQLYQGSRIKTLPPYALNMESADIRKDYFILGADNFGRDILSRMIYGTRVSLGVALIATLVSLLIGITLGLISGYFQKIFDAVFMRITDIFLSFPVIFLLLLIVGLFGNSFFYIAVFLGLTTWMDVARLTRGQVLSVKNELYVLSARAIGFSSYRILYRHVLPNVITPVIINAAFRIGNIILMESALSFIGLGIGEPVSSWGNIINSGKDTLLNAWWISLFPGLTITFVVILLNYTGDTFRKTVKIK